ncbi:unnamed protein product [Brachionus calyciflorus]|uniref:Platelet-derived growth factor (PDGF) family profile domain-containing protein n=1 Tax=Brachionus calyciflorus TaxID=104777 RepID=A0A813N8C4_9BILA|nr:unnamed protein product [Brachionus calyciflorus]
MLKTLFILSIFYVSCLAFKNKDQIMKDLFKANGLADLQRMGIKMKQKPSGIIGRTNGQDLADAKDVTPGKCDPKPVCITNPLASNLKSNDEIAYPTCITVHRCDGCCASNEVCVPIKTEDLKLKNVAVISFQNGQLNGLVGDVISVTNHTDCECQCKWKTDSDCQEINKNFIKSPDACECTCPINELKCSGSHIFDSSICDCKCKDIYDKSESNCRSKGFFWNSKICKCNVFKTNISVSETNFN